MMPHRLLPFVIGATLALGATAQTVPVTGLDRRPDLPDRIAGAVLLTELGCAACHSPSRPELTPKQGPDLSAVGARVSAAHLRRFLASPAGTKPGTTMPDVLGHLPDGDRAVAAEALTHFLASLGGPAPEATRPAPDAVERGRTLYHSVGCVACHSPEEPLPGSVPLGPLAEKYSVESLTRFLEDPLAVRPSGRMPDLHLDHFEAQDIASYLLREQPADPPTFQPDPQLATRGRTLFGEHRCGACHPGVAVAAAPAAPPLDRLRVGEGCLSGRPGPWPRHSLAPAQRAALGAVLAALDAPFGPAEAVEMTVTRLDCRACHERDGTGGPGPEREVHFTGRDPGLGDQGRIPPSLTGVGSKLKARWLRDVVVNGAGARPYLHTRMPRFGAPAAEALAGWLKQVDPVLPVPGVHVAEAEKPRQVGRELAGSQGFNCVACHTFRGRSAAPIRALDLTTMTDRLEEGWFHRYLESPRRYSPLTIMPDFWPDGRSPFPEVLGGDAVRQRDALWQYLAEGPESGEPRGLVLEPLEIHVGEEAVMLRRAYPGIGKRGIGVGYPSGIHLAFDAGQMRLGSVWSGGFIEASALWRGQGAGQARILGRDRVDFPAGPAFAVLPSAGAPWPSGSADVTDETGFLGYILDAQRRPTFRYRIGAVRVADTFRDRSDTTGRPWFERTLEFFADRLPDGLHFRVAVAEGIERTGDRTYAVGDRLVVRLPADGVLRDAGGKRELLLPVRGPVTLEYRLTGTP